MTGDRRAFIKKSIFTATAMGLIPLYAKGMIINEHAEKGVSGGFFSIKEDSKGFLL
jgi:hypothetical protein